MAYNIFDVSDHQFNILGFIGKLRTIAGAMYETNKTPALSDATNFKKHKAVSSLKLVIYRLCDFLIRFSRRRRLFFIRNCKCSIISVLEAPYTDKIIGSPFSQD